MRVLASPCYRDDERTEFPPELVAALGPLLSEESADDACAARVPQESQAELRLLMTEALLLLSASPVAREAMRDLSICAQRGVRTAA